MKYSKGQRGYLSNKKMRTVIFCLIMIAIGVAMVVTGYMATHTKKNLLTVAGILFVLPAAKFFTIYVTMAPYHPMKQSVLDVFRSVLPVHGKEYVDLVFTSTEKIMHLDYLCVCGTELCGYSEGDAKKDETIISYFTESMKKRGVYVHMHIFHNEDAMRNRMMNLTDSEVIPEEVTDFLQTIIV